MSRCSKGDSDMGKMNPGIWQRGCGLLATLAMLLQGFLTLLPPVQAETADLMRDAVATATFEQDDTYYKGPASQAVDGDLSTRWSSYGAKLPQAIQVDLGESRTIDSVVSYWYGDGRTYTYDLYLTNTPTIVNHAFTAPTDAVAVRQNLVATGSGDDKGVVASVSTTVDLGTAVRGRYITINCTKAMKTATEATNAAAIWEIQVHGGQQEEEGDCLGRHTISINNGWKFYKGTASGAQAVAYNDTAWTAVDLPHTWNAEDGQDGGSNYYRGDGWYRREIPWNENYRGKQVYVSFEGANIQTDVYINGTYVGNHKGGYTAFRMDITPILIPGQSNLIAVKVNNAHTQQIAPLSADFTFFGGVYRGVSLLVLEPTAHVDALDNGSDGLYLTTTDVSEQEATLGIRAAIVNDSATQQTVTVSAELRNPVPGSIIWIDDSLLPTEWLSFDPAAMTPGGSVETVTQTITIPAGESVTFDQSITVEDPRLWNGKTDPYRYQVELIVRDEDGNALDQLSDFVGFRYDEVDADKGYFLNGRSYPLRGVNRHQDREDMGWAISNTQHAQDFALIYEIGANTIRLAHYPHADYFYELCDMYGIVVWAEIPFVDQIGGSGTYENPDANREAFFETTKQQMRELIRQQYNRPSIVCWGLQNEIRYGDFEGVAQAFLGELNDLVHTEDPTRFTTQAIYNATPSDTATWPSDVVSWNLYPGWYYSSADKFGEDVDKRRAKDPDRPMGLSEYGYGSNILHHQETITKPAVNTYEAIQSEEYQCWAHEQAWAAIEERDYLWATHVWNMFDFGVDNRNEAGYPGINNKGLVSYDRQVKKDAFYFYQANWSDQSVVHLNSSRFTVREQDKITVKGYSNLESAELLVNGVSYGTLTQSDLVQKTVFVWENIPLQWGENTVVMRGQQGGETITDTVVWQYGDDDSTAIVSDVLSIDPTALTIALQQAVTVEDIAAVITANQGATLRVLQADGETVVTTGDIQPGMRLQVTSANGANTALYTFRERNLAAGRPATASSVYGKENSQAAFAVDSDSTTRWTADLTPNATYPAWITVDLEQVYALDRIETDWFTGTGDRCYYYKIEVSEDGETFHTIVDRTANTTVGAVSDEVENVQGRYLRITVTGNSDLVAKPTAAASLFELRVYGQSPTADTYRPGDVDQNGEVEANDALLALQAATGKIAQDTLPQKAADVDGAAGVTANDALMILQYATNKINGFEQQKLVAFTFGDGPVEYTQELLDELAARDVQATS